jgi:LCP family protein required for cell wall assembly
VTAAVVAVAVTAVALPTLLDRTTPAAGPRDENVLLLGLDRSRNAELLMLAHLDADGTAAMVSLPDIMPRSGGSSYPLDEVYQKLGADQLREDVERLTGVRVDHYAALDMDAFGELATAVGGVPVCVKETTKDPNSGVTFRAGTHTIAGAKAIAFLRQQDDAAIPYPDVTERQEAFLTGLASKAGDVDSQAVLDVLGKRLRTDEDLDVLGLAARLESVKGVRFAEVGADLSVPMETGPGEMVLPIVTVQEFVTDMFAGASHPGGPGTPELKFSKQRCVY